VPTGIGHAELAAVFTISHGMDISETINRKWYKRRTGYFGPEIKIFRNFPLKYITHCFINLLKLKIQLPFWLSDPFRKQNAPALNQGISL